MSAAHTPGPWFVVPLHSPAGFHMIATKIGDREPLICGVEHSKMGPIDHAQAAINARLIAAAPELLEELQNIVNAKRFDRSVFPTDAEFIDWAQSRARTAIAITLGAQA